MRWYKGYRVGHNLSSFTSKLTFPLVVLLPVSFNGVLAQSKALSTSQKASKHEIFWGLGTSADSNNIRVDKFT